MKEYNLTLFYPSGEKKETMTCAYIGKVVDYARAKMIENKMLSKVIIKRYEEEKITLERAS